MQRFANDSKCIEGVKALKSDVSGRMPGYRLLFCLIYFIIGESDVFYIPFREGTYRPNFCSLRAKFHGLVNWIMFFVQRQMTCFSGRSLVFSVYR